ncbi:conjugative transfer signal peptidase TraF [Rhizobium calliandrae]|uniref:Conjugative transfer signal peptidase TraF n=1 Tax=Rhizobium calliandrae TaxID=1312182 RepID=A0ABT7KD85_9HYPH|nr:conjugative transfer signal peptidase TraF [Rhizobium calliandrae]MDL2406142.1 conjugative transfer signal peptidase TraF [Rhizobium calliandrae]
MKKAIRPHHRVLRIGHTGLVVPCILATLVTFIFAAFVAGRLRINMTPSEPLGLWRIADPDRPIVAGDRVFICPPQTTAFSAGLRLGYLRRGLCPGGYAALIKTVIAFAGDRIEIGPAVRVNGVEIVGSALRPIDGKGRPLAPTPGGIVPPAEVFLFSRYPASWDSRYFGPVPASGILGLAQEVLTYAP